MPMQIPLWVRLRFVSNSSAAKATILIPLIGYLVLFNQTIVNFLNLIKELNGSHDVGVSYRLILLYLGLCAIALGVLIYGWFCPNEVKHYGSAAAFVQGDGPSLRGFVMSDLQVMIAKTEPYKTKLEELSRELDAKNHEAGIDHNDRERYRIENLHLYFDFLNRSHRIARLICVASYFVGFSLLAIPSAEVFVGVTAILVKKMIG
jgi:predicted membrane channel-forming protein YqfA (hemolysin III family)